MSTMSQPHTEYTLNIIKADNGWVIRLVDGNGGPYGQIYSDVLVVKDDENLAETIAAALVSGRLQQKSEQSRMQRLLGEQSMKVQMGSILGSPTYVSNHQGTALSAGAISTGNIAVSSTTTAADAEQDAIKQDTINRWYSRFLGQNK